MSQIYFGRPQEQDLNYEGFFDGQNKTIPEGTELTAICTGGFVGQREGKNTNECAINLIINSEGEFYGQKYRYNAKVFDMDAMKRDLAMKNLSVLDAQAGFPMTNGKLALTTENIEENWTGKAQFRVKFGLMVAQDDGREINFVRGFGYWREKMVQPAKKVAPKPKPAEEYQEVGDEPDVDF